MSATMAYSKSFFNKDDLIEFADRYLALLPADVTVLLSSGSSGCAIATAMIMRSRKNLAHVYIKKDGENSHRPSSGVWPTIKVAAIVDDFIEDGNTIRHIYNRSELKFNVTPKYVLVHNCNSDYNEIWTHGGILDGLLFGPKLILIEEEE